MRECKCKKIGDLVAEFHRTCGHPVRKVPGLISFQRAYMQSGLIFEEAEELVKAIDNEDLVEVADALGDLLYVVYGMALEYGVPLDAVVKEIHRSNMTKLDPLTKRPRYREDGKILKGAGYEPPEIGEILREGGWKG